MQSIFLFLDVNLCLPLFVLKNECIFVAMGWKIKRVKIVYFVTSLLLIASTSIGVAQQKDTTTKTIDTAAFFNSELDIVSDNPIVKQMDEALLSFMKEYDQFTTDTAVLNVNGFAEGEKPEVSDSVIKERLRILDDNTPFSLEYNETTKSYINLYVNKRRRLVSILLARKEYYFPMFEEKLAQYKVPQELKYLAIVESALRSDVESWATAAGLWQFMYTTGKMYGLEVDSYKDDRKDPFLATDAAARHLRDLYNIYDDWELALAAYNSGPGNVNKAIRKAGGVKNFWAIYDYLPRETQGYVPAFIAVNYAMNHAADHNIYPLQAKWKYYEMDTLYVNDRVDFKVAAKYLDAPLEDLVYLNPRYIHKVIPNNETANCLYLPKDKIGDYLANEDSIIHYSREFKKVYDKQIFASSGEGRRITYRVRSGDYLGKISRKFGCKVSDIKKWNRLRRNNLKIGQRLVIYTKNKKGKASKSKKTKPKVENIKGFDYYTIKQGDTLWDIASKFPNVSVEDLKRHNKGLKSSNLKLGSKIKIVKKG